MEPCRVHITGASGSGVTTLGRALAAAWSVPCHDADDYYWQPTDPPFATKRPEGERLALMEALFLPRGAWVLSGSLMGWGDPLRGRFDAVVFLTLAPAVRMARLVAREAMRHAAGEIAPGGALHEAHRAFLDWAVRYDDPAFRGRSRAGHLAWLADLACPVLQLDSAAPVDRLVAEVMAWQPE
jgi:adenylate kinase family enzyme